MATDVTIPQIGESVATVFIATWMVGVGDRVNVGDPIVEIDSDKASMEVPSSIAGTILELVGEEGDEVPVGAVIARIDESDAPATDAPASSADAGPAEAEDELSSDGGVRAGPAARAQAQETKVDLKGVSGSGPRGRVTTADVAQAAAQGGVSQGPAPAAPAPAPEGRTTRRKMSPLRRTIARRLVEAQQTAAMLTTFNEVDMSAVMDLRKRYKQRFIDTHEVKLGFMSFFVKAVVEALKAFPAVNAEIDGNEIIYKHYYNIGVAVSGPKGLVVPVLRDADQHSFSGVEKAIGDLGRRARDNELSMDDFADGTFTISNGGVFGSMMSTPILNPPQSGILGMHNIVQRPVVVDGQVVIRPIMYLALSYDHRIIDGREAVSFLVRIKDLVEDPERLLLEI